MVVTWIFAALSWQMCLELNQYKRHGRYKACLRLPYNSFHNHHFLKTCCYSFKCWNTLLLALLFPLFYPKNSFDGGTEINSALQLITHIIHWLVNIFKGSMIAFEANFLTEEMIFNQKRTHSAVLLYITKAESRFL